MVRLVVREGMRLAAIGITLGLAMNRVKPNAAAYAVVAGALAATALAASWKPALQAARVDPATALREE